MNRSDSAAAREFPDRLQLGTAARPTRERRKPSSPAAGLRRQTNAVVGMLRAHPRRSSNKPGAHDKQREEAGPRVFDVRERSLIQAARGGDEGERARLVEVFTPSIGRIARTYRGAPSISHPELMQAGTLGLLQALERFDVERGTHFWAYASWYVRQAMQELVSELSGPVVLSDRAHRQLALVVQKRGERQQSSRRDPTSSELSASTGFARAKVEHLLAARQTPRSLDAPVREEGDASATPADALVDRCAESSYERVARHDDIERLPSLLERLTERERIVLSGRFGLGQRELTLAELGARLGISAERVRQVEEAALIRLHNLSPPQ